MALEATLLPVCMAHAPGHRDLLLNGEKMMSTDSPPPCCGATLRIGEECWAQAQISYLNAIQLFLLPLQRLKQVLKNQFIMYFL